MTDLRVAIAGAGGRMGAANIRAVTAAPGIVVHSAFERPGSAAIGRDAGELAGIGALGVTVGDDAEAAVSGADAIIDFTGPAVSVMLAELAAARGLVDIIGTTGCSREEDWAIAKSGSAGARIVKSGNFSLGVNLLAGLVRQVARALPDYDVEVLEMHHNRKVDAPSGTALMLGQAAAEAATSISTPMRCGCATATPARVSPAPSALRRSGAAASWASIRFCSWARPSASRSCIAPPTAACSRRALYGQRCGPRTSRPDFTTWPTCSASRSSQAWRER